MAINLQHIAVVAHQRILHLTRKCCRVLTADAYTNIIVADTLGKAPGTKGREVQFVVVTRLNGSRCLTLKRRGLRIPEFYQHTLAVIEVLQVVNGLIFVVQFTSLLIDNLSSRYSILDTLQ